MKRNLNLNEKVWQFVFLATIIIALSSCSGKKWTEENKGTFRLIHNKNGQSLGISINSKVEILTIDNYAFKDLNRNKQLDIYEDWRKSADERAMDLASKMTIEQIAGLMLYSGHQAIPSLSGGWFGGTYGGKTFAESGASPFDLSDQQIKFLTEDHLRHVLITTVESPVIAAEWNNKAQALAESLEVGIPVNTSSDPRHGTVSTAEYNAGAGGKISMWPGSLGLAATFDPEIVKTFGHIASKEYRALGISTALSPQIDLGTEPRWNRLSGTFGEDPLLSTDLARAYVDGFQTSEGESEISDGWGYTSVNAMVKHWPGGGSEEGGRDGHFGYGSYAVYPGKNFNDHLMPFIEGAFKLHGKTASASAVMPYYTISHNQDTVYGENVGNGFSKYLITDLLREKYNYDGVVCTDWMITGDVQSVHQFQGKSWGAENLSVAERHYKIIMAGVDQFGGNNAAGPVIEAYNTGVAEHGEEFMRKRFEQSAVRLLKNIFRLGLFENPYLVAEESGKIVGNPEFMKAGYEAQLKSIVLLKNNKQVLPLKKDITVYIPQKFYASSTNWFGVKSEEYWKHPVNIDIAAKYFNITDDPSMADCALVFVESPHGITGYDTADLQKGGNGYVPIPLQYKPYKAEFARGQSIAGGSPFEKFTNRTYKGKTTEPINKYDLVMITQTSEKMGKKPLIVVSNVSNPMIFGEFENFTGAILVHFGVQDQAIFDILTGIAEPSGLLPFQMPADMKTVELQNEDVPHDMNCFHDSDNNIYDFGFGLNWKGKISDNRTEKYIKAK